VGTERAKTKHLARKLLAIREQLGVSQSQLVRLLDTDKRNARISEYERGTREPDLNILLKYAKLARVSLDRLADDTRELKFRNKLEKAKTCKPDLKAGRCSQDTDQLRCESKSAHNLNCSRLSCYTFASDSD
jgi:transcriptional regulator with XRE-family HTH domain